MNPASGHPDSRFYCFWGHGVLQLLLQPTVTEQRMKSIVSPLALLAVVISLVATWTHEGRGSDGAQQRTPVMLTRIYTGPDGQTHAERVDMKLTPVAGTLAQSREESQKTTVTSSQFVRFAPGYVQDWHPAAARRYVITLSGQGEVELPGGVKLPLGPGRILQADDITGKGHITRTIGQADWVALFVQFDQ